MRTISILVLVALFLFLAVVSIAQAASDTPRALHVLSSGYLYHDGNGGVSNIPVPSNGHPEQAIVQPIGSSIRHMTDGIGPVTGTTGFTVPANDYYPLISGDAIRDWRFRPPPGSGVTVYYQIEGIPF